MHVLAGQRFFRPHELWMRRVFMIRWNRSMATKSMFGSRSRMSSSRAEHGGVLGGVGGVQRVVEAAADGIEEGAEFVQR